jgi:all-trans-retinol 13,14-reductase
MTVNDSAVHPSVSTSRHWDVLIVGSGISALTCAILLARQGKSVCVLEQYSKPGGYMHSFKRHGATYETGAHYFGALGKGQPFRVLLEYLEVYRADLFTALDPAGFDRLYFPERTIDLPQGYDAVIATLSSHFPSEHRGIVEFFKRMQDVVRFFPTYTFNDDSDLRMPPEALDVSLSSVVESVTQSAPLRAVLLSMCGLHGVHPRDVAFGLHSLVMDSLIRGAHGLAGSGDDLTAAFVTKLKSYGGQLVTRARVMRFEQEGREIKRVHLQSGETYSAEWIISAIHPKATLRLLEDPQFLSPAFRERIGGLTESSGLFGIYAQASVRPQFSAQQNAYFFSSSDPDKLFAPHDIARPPSGVFLSPAQRTWTGSQTTFPMSIHFETPYAWFLPWAGERYNGRSAAYMEMKMKLKQKAFEVMARYEPGMVASFSKIETSTPLTNLHFNGSEEGSAYGIYHSMANTGARALGPRTKVANLLLTGQNYLFPGLMGASISALRTTGHIIGIKGMLRELKERGQS